MAEIPIQQNPGGETGGLGGGSDPRREASLRFWRNFTQANEAECREALALLGTIRGEDYGGLALEGSASPDSGKFVLVDVPLSSPKSARNAWASDKLTTLMRVVPDIHCLAFDGDDKKHDGGDYFVACAQLDGGGTGADVCSFTTHRKPKRIRAEIEGPAFMVKVRASSAATKPKVLTGVHLLEADLPKVLVECGLSEALQEYRATPEVWRTVLECYPGKAKMEVLLAGDVASEKGDTLLREPEDSVAGASYKSPRPQSIPEQVSLNASKSLGSRADSLGSLDQEYAEPSYTRRVYDNPGETWGSWRGGGTPSSASRHRGDAPSFPGSYPAQEWKPELKKVEVRARAEMNARFTQMDKALEGAFKTVDDRAKYLEQEVRFAQEKATAAREEGKKGFRKAIELGARVGVLEDNAEELPFDRSGGRDRLRVDTTMDRGGESRLSWEALTEVEREQMTAKVLENLDYDRLAAMMAQKTGISAMQEEARRSSARLAKIEHEFASEHGVVSKLQEQVATWDARRDTATTERGGYTFSGLEDVQALVALAGDGRLSTLCLDLVGLLTISQEPYVTYEAGIQVHANAIKANFNSVAESQINLSFQTPFPELLVSKSEASKNAARGGAKWAPMFATAEMFEDAFRDGSHRRVIKGIDKAHELTQKEIDQEFPLSVSGDPKGDNRKIHTILTDQNRKAYRQCIGFIECLLPFYRTLKGGSLTAEDAWDRVFVFVLEFLTAIRDVRVIRKDMRSESAMIWGAFKATDLAEEFRTQNFVEHPKALSILALTSIEREGKTMELLEQRVAKQIADAGKGDKLTKLDTRIQTVENKLKNIIAKNPELK